MADQQQQQQEDDEESIFVYSGGQAPYNVRHVRVDESIDAIADEAFWNNPYLEYIEMHNRVGRIGYQAFRYCPALKGIKLSGVEVIEYGAFADCGLLEYVEFGNKLRSIEECAFFNCTSIERVQFASPLHVGKYAFEDCEKLTEVELPEEVKGVECGAFEFCPSLQRISMPLKDGIFRDQAVYGCEKLSTINIIGSIHKTISYLSLESWRNEIYDEIDRVNTVLPDADQKEKTHIIQQWMKSVSGIVEHYKNEHYNLIHEAMIQLDLALWKVNLDEKNGCSLVGEVGTTTNAVLSARARQEQFITSRAGIVIKNVLPFLELP